MAVGPTLSPLGQFVTRVATPRIAVEHRFVPAQATFGACLGCIADRFLWACDDPDDINERLRVATVSRAAATN